ncbi:MAG: DUF362 domain-containing protein [Deltaproteobacteria bacterium]|nr:DUF362 domain-containing protein [Deltaproteobacteria bacterium]
MSQVLVRQTTYDHPALRPLIFEMMEAMGGAHIQGGSRVLIKPNLLAPATPRQAILTHPAIVRMVVEYVLEKGARPLVSDSPAIGSFAMILRMSGIRDALKGLDCECRPFQNSTQVDIGGPFGQIAIAEEPVRADVIVNLAKLKTHSQMLLTLAVKNLFGCIIGYRKPEWHMRAGIDRRTFARLLVRIGSTLRPSFNILDGILALEGQGPGPAGVPKRLGVLMAGRDPFAVDLAVCRMLGLDPGAVPILEAAMETESPLTEPEIDGTLPEIRGFLLPRPTSLVYGPRFLHGFIRRQILQRPVCDGVLCRMCGECGKICPAGAITTKEMSLRFDYDRCIRCYCCIEICPFGALRSDETLTGKIIRRAAAVILPPGKTR